ncbi:MAG: PAS domain S-box protein [Desulfobacterales bacterium]|jgi:PAS domain-containing protein|nr:MAG: PAS domain S-box protein [Desulfobacterales bacterium]
MKKKSTYKELEQRVIQLENESPERKPAEEALRESEERLRTFMDSVADFFAVTDKNENLIYVNRSMAETLGYAKEEIIGMHITEIISEESGLPRFSGHLSGS